MTRTQINLWRRYKRKGLKVLKVGNDWTWSMNYGEYNGAWPARREAIVAAIIWGKGNL